MKKIIHLMSFLGLLLFIWLLSRLDYKHIIRIFQDVNYIWIFVGLLFTVVELYFKAYKLKGIVNLVAPIRLWDSFKVYLIGLPYGMVTPGKVGDVVKLYTLQRKTGIQKTDCLALGLVERLLEMIALVVLAGIGILVLIGHLNRQQFYILFAAVFVMIVGMLIILDQRLVRFLLRPVFYLLVPAKMQSRPRELFYQFYGGIEKYTIHRFVMAKSLGLCLLGWLAGSIRTYFFAKSIGLGLITFIQTLFLIPLVTVFELLPISILGIGTRDVSLITLFSLMGYTSPDIKEIAISLSLMMLVLGGIPQSILGYFISIRENIRWHDVKDLDDN